MNVGESLTSAPQLWRADVSATGLSLLGMPGEDERRGVLSFDDLDLAEFERRYRERARGNAVFFERFRRIWESDACRRSLVPRARIAATEEDFPPDLPRGLDRCRLAVVWTLGADVDFGRFSDGDALVELLLDMGSTLLIFAMWRRLLARIADVIRPAGLYVTRTFQPYDAETIRRLFDLPGIRGMEGVGLNAGGLIVPMKSRCAVVALGTVPTELPRPSPCPDCGGDGCIYGRMGLCPHTFSESEP